MVLVGAVLGADVTLGIVIAMWRKGSNFSGLGFFGYCVAVAIVTGALLFAI
ncbi:hypothetical protein ACWDT5_22385 [Rhodococcus aetherivorans]